MRLKYIAFQNPSFNRENKCILFLIVQNKNIVFILLQYILKRCIFYTPDWNAAYACVILRNNWKSQIMFETKVSQKFI